MRFDEKGREVVDSTPISVPHNWQRPLSLHEEIKRFVRAELSRAAQDQDVETFEDADDFDIDEDPDPLSAYELPLAPLDAPGGVPVEDADPPPSEGEKAPKEAVKASEGQ